MRDLARFGVAVVAAAVGTALFGAVLALALLAGERMGDTVVSVVLVVALLLGGILAVVALLTGPYRDPDDEP